MQRTSHGAVNSESSHQVSGAQTAGLQPIHAQLNTKCEELTLLQAGVSRGTNTKDVAAHILDITRLLESTSEVNGSIPIAHLLGHRVVCNVLHLVLNRIVEPALKHYCSKGAAAAARRGAGNSDDAKARNLRSEVIRPFRLLVDAVHYNLIDEPRTTQRHVGREPPGAQPQPVPTSHTSSGARNGYRKQDAAMGNGHPSGVGAPLSESTSHAPRMAPLTWKQCAPLNILLSHILEVISSDTLVRVVGAEYASLMEYLLTYDAYSRQLTPKFATDLCVRAIALMERVGYEHTPESELEERLPVDEGVVYANLLAQLFCSPSASSWFRISDLSGHGNERVVAPHARRPVGSMPEAHVVVTRVVRLLLARHAAPSTSLKLEARTIRALRHMMRALHEDHLEASREAPLELVKVLCDLFVQPVARRRESWQLEVLEFVVLQLSLSLSQLLGDSVLRDLEELALQRVPSSLSVGRASRVSAVSPRYHALIHDTILPMALHLLCQQPQMKYEYSFVSRRELFFCPCPALDVVFHFGAVVVYAASVLHSQHPPPDEPLASDLVEEEAHGERRKRSRGAEATELAAQRTAATDHRSPAERFTAALMAVSFLHVDTDSVAGDGGADVDPPSPQRPRVDATESVVIPRGEVQDGLLYLLQTLALPCTSLHFTSHQCDALVTDCILPLHDHYGSAMTSLLVSVLCALAPRCSPKIRHRVLSWAIMRHVPSGGSTQVEHGAEPREEVYRLLSVLLQSEILKDGTEAVVDAASASSTSVVTALRHLATSSHFTQVSIMADSITRAQAARVRNAEIRLATSAASPGSLLDAARGGALHLPRPEVGSSSLTSCTSMSPPLLLEMLHTLTSYECHALVRRDEVAIEPSLQLETSAWTGLPFVCASLSYATIFFDNRGNKSSWGLWEKVLHQVENYVVACALHANLNQDMPVSPGAAGSITNAFTAQGRGLTAGFIARQREEIRTLRRTPLTQVPAILTEATAGQWLLLSQPPSTEDNKVGSEAAVFPRHVVSETFLEVLAGSVRQAITVLANRAAMAPKEAMLFVPSATAADASRDGYGRNSSAVDEGALEQLHLCLGVQCVQLLHFLLRLRRRRLWLVPEEVCSRGDSVLTTEAGGGSYNDAEVLQSATDFVKAPADVMRVLSPHGVMHYAVLWICRFLAERLLRGPLMLWLPLLQALHPLMADVGHELLTPSVACAESRQVIMNMVGVLVRRLLPDGIQKLQRSGATPLFFSAESSSRAVKTVCVCADLLRIILATAHKTKVLLSSADPLLESGTVREVLVTTFQAEGLLGETTSFSGGGPATLRADEGEKADARLLSAEDAVNVPTTTPPFLLPAVYAIGRLLWMLHTDYGEQGARLAVLHLTHTLYFRFRYNMMESIFALLEHAARACADYTSTNSGLDFVYEGRLLEWLVDTTAPQDEVHQRGSPHGPALTTSLQCAMLSSIFWTTPLCSPRVAEKLGKYSFTLLSAGTPYEVRRHTASQVHVLFDRFSNRTESVLRELLLRAREGMMSTSESLCSTSLLALSEAARAAPWLESRVIFSSAIESWATREFQLRPQLLQFLNRIATFSVDALHYRNTRLEQDDQRTCVAPYARLCRVHLRSLLFQWLWECGHDVDAFPAECVGYHSVDELLRHHLDIVLPLAMLVCGRSAHSSPGGPGRAASRDDETDAMLLYQPDPLLHRVLRHAAKAVEGSAGWSDDGAPMIPLLAYFPTITAQLSVLAHAGTHNQPSETHRRPRSTTTRTADEELLYGGPPTHQRRPVNTTSVASAELQDAATAALHWMHQLMNYRVERTHICVALHHMAYSAHPGFLHDAVEAHVDRLEKAAGSGVRFVNVLLLTLADRILVHMVELLGDALPFAPTEEVLQRVMQQQLADPAMTAAESLGILTTRPAVAANNGLDCLFLLHDGHMAYTLFQWLYARLVEQPSSDDELSSLYVNGAESACCLSTSLAERRYASRRRQARYLGLLLSMCKTWMSREVLRQPHVLRTIVGVATHLIRICPEHQRTVGDILLHVWGSVSGGVDAASSPLDQHLARQQRIWPNDILLASSLLAQVEESPALASTWTALCRCDPLLAQRDWQLLSTQYSIHQSIQRETEDDEVVIVEDDAQLETEVNATSMLYTSPSSLATQKHARALLPLLQHLRFMGGSTSARCFDTLARTIDEAHHGLSQMIGRGAALKGRGSGAAHAPQRSPEDPRNSEQRLCVIFHDSCCQAVVDLLRMLLRVRHDGVEDQDPMEARHFASSSLPLQQAGMRLLRSISWCFVESGEVVALETFVRGQLIDVGGDAAMVMDAVEDDRATISSLHPVDLSIGHLFGKLLSRLYASAFDSDSALASQASHALELWLQQDARPALPEDSSATRKSSQSMAAWPVDQSILHLARFCCRLQLVKESATQAATSALDLSSSNATVDGDVMDSGSLMTMVALAAAAMESARWRPFQRFGLPHGPSAPPSSTFSLLDERVWHELSTHHNERGFLTLFVIGAMNSYGIPQRYHIAAIMLPLLEQESPLHWSSRRHHNGSTGGAAETTHWGELWFPIVLLHIFMLPKESDKARDVRSRWSSLLDEHLVQHAREYPLAARLLLHTLETCRRALQANTRLRGLKAFQPSKFVASNAPPAMSSLIGQVPTLTDMKQAYWLSDIGAQHLAEAALQLGEVHLAQCYAELSGESLLGPAAGIPNEQSVAQLFEGAGEAHSVLFPSAPPNSSCASTTSRRFRELAQHHEIRQKLLAFHEQLQSVLRRCLSYSGEPSTFGEQGDGARRGCSSSETSLNNSWAYALVRAEQTSDCQRKLAHGMDMRDAFAEYNEALVGKARLLMSGGMEQTAAEMLVGSSLNGQSLCRSACMFGGGKLAV